MLSWYLTNIDNLLIMFSVVKILFLLGYIVDLTVDISLIFFCYNIYLVFCLLQHFIIYCFRTIQTGIGLNIAHYIINGLRNVIDNISSLQILCFPQILSYNTRKPFATIWQYGDNRCCANHLDPK